MSEDQSITPIYVSKVDELTHNLQGVEAAIQAAVRNGDDDQEWLVWLQQRRTTLLQQLAKECDE